MKLNQTHQKTTDSESNSDNYRVTFGHLTRNSVEVFTKREAEVVGQTACMVLGASNADIVIEQMCYVIKCKEPEGKPDSLWDYCFTKAAAERLEGIVWKNTRFNHREYYYEYVPRSQLEEAAKP